MVFRQDPFRQLLATTRKGVRGRLKRDALSAISCNGKLVPSHGVLRPYWQTACRCLSSTGSNAFANTFGLKFSISPEKALQKFEYWARSEQGLNRFVLPRSSIRISAAYCPVWSFDINIRYIKTNKKTGKKRFDWKPDLFSIYGTQSVIHLAGLSAYAGYTYRRSLIDPLHNTSLIFLGDKTVPFGSWMLQDMKLETGESLSVSPDPWNATRGRAWDVVKEGLSSLPGVEDSGMESQPQVQTEIVSARRVYMPTYSVNYHILGME